MTFVGNAETGSPVFDYSSRDYAAVYQDLVNRIPVYLPEWTSTSVNDFGIVLIQMFAYTADLMGYYLDRLAGEAFIQTATQASSIINLAAMLDYTPTLATGAVAELAITIGASVTGPVTIPAGSEFSTVATATQAAIVFQTDAALVIAGANSATPSLTGTVAATQGTTYTSEAVATSDGTVNQSYPLINNPVSANSFVVYVDLGYGPQEWTYTPSLINSGPYSQVFTDFVDANGVFYIIFGDGVNGYVPPLGSPITCTYQTTVGALGNVGAGTITQPVSALVGVVGVTNAAQATGGTGAESLISIQQNAPASLKTLNRAVTVSDMENLTLQVPGVQWASAEQQTYQLVNLYVCPFGGSNPSSVLQAAIEAYVEPLSMANTTITIFPPTYVEINITVNVVIYPTFGNTATQQSVIAALSTLLSLSSTGFGFRVALGLVYQTILGIPGTTFGDGVLGVDYAIVTALNRQVLATLTSPISNGASVNSLSVTQLPQGVNAGDSIIINAGNTSLFQAVAVTVPVAAGATTIPVNSFTANASYGIGTPVQDTTAVEDCILLPSEIPVAGTFIVNVTGGLAGS